MGETDEDSIAAASAWHQPQDQPTDKPTDTAAATAATIEQAKKFLEDEEVQTAPRVRKMEFLKSKGFEEAVVERLLADEPDQMQPEVKETVQDDVKPSMSTSTTAESHRIDPEDNKRDDRPPIVIYPDFLMKPARPPPLITIDRFLNTLCAFAGLSTLVYGTSQFVISPMVESLTEARVSLHETANEKLSKVVEKLQRTVSEIPPTKKPDVPAHPNGNEENASECDDPTELFHRDIGVQTSLPSSPRPQQSFLAENASAEQARRLSRVAASLKSLTQGFGATSDAYEEVATAISPLQDKLKEMGYYANQFTGSYNLGSVYSLNRNEPDDEIKKARDNVRRIKGALLNARSFPTGH